MSIQNNHVFLHLEKKMCRPGRLCGTVVHCVFLHILDLMKPVKTHLGEKNSEKCNCLPRLAKVKYKSCYSKTIVVFALNTQYLLHLNKQHHIN